MGVKEKFRWDSRKDSSEILCRNANHVLSAVYIMVSYRYLRFLVSEEKNKIQFSWRIQSSYNNI